LARRVENLDLIAAQNKTRPKRSAGSF